ncbi:MAG TPA: ABC-2 transporter permease [Candidatus Tetragenococcus pullicola]|nr:ABC-2 transporter permease [Candidatus Tetragenococcus pullicola]
MKGLWLKDWFILKRQWKVLLFFLLISVINGYTSGLAFLTFFMSFFFVSLATSTIVYDQENHGLEYLLTLPFHKKKYIQQKSQLILVSAGLAMFLSFFCMMGIAHIFPEKITEAMLVTLLISFLFSFFFGMLMSALYLKFGAEQGRIFLFVMIGVVILGSFLLAKLPKEQMSSVLVFFARLTSVSFRHLFLGGIVLLAMIYSFGNKINYHCLLHSKVN